MPKEHRPQIYCWSPPAGESVAELKRKKRAPGKKHLGTNAAIPIVPIARRKGDCILVQWLTQVSKRKASLGIPNHSVPKLWLAQDIQRKTLGEL